MIPADTCTAHTAKPVSRRSLLGWATLSSAVLGATRTSAQTKPGAGDDEIKRMITKYAAAVDAADTKLAGEVWLQSPEVSFIHPAGHEHGWEEVKGFFEKQMGAAFSERKLTPADIVVHLHGDSAWAEFYWHFRAKVRSDGSTVESRGRETQIYRKLDSGRWALVHVHYSGMPVALPS